VTEVTKYLRGAFIAFEPKSYPGGKRMLIPFRFNPETLSRSLQVEAGKSGGGTEAAKQGATKGDAAADASLGSLRQTFTVQVRFDFDDRHESVQTLPPELGILPEISALENLLYPAASPGDANSDGKEPVKARRARPTVLFVWGTRRVLPVRITGMTINETRFNWQLNPTRAEVDVVLEVLGEGDAKDNRAVSDALDFTGRKRAEMAEQFFAGAAAQGTNILPL
jgi:hypothetical protein